MYAGLWSHDGNGSKGVGLSVFGGVFSRLDADQEQF